MTTIKVRFFPLLLLVLALAPGGAALAADFTTVEQVLAADTPPDGVVFEIATADDNALEWAIPIVRRDAARLRKQFPQLDIALVTHGEEQFGLRKQEGDTVPRLQSLARALVEDDGIQLHVCGTFAGWRGLSEEDFPDFIDVTAAGPAQVNMYRELGFVVILVRQDDDDEYDM